MNGTQRRQRALAALGIALTFTLGSLRVAAGELGELGSLEGFKERFNRDAGKPRLVLLLSPT